MTPASTLVAPKSVAQRILLIRGHKVMIDADLADLYGVPTKALNQAVRRNLERFPSDFIFQLTTEEKQEVVTNCDHLAKLKFPSPYKAPDKLEITVGTDEADLNACVQQVIGDDDAPWYYRARLTPFCKYAISAE